MKGKADSKDFGIYYRTPSGGLANVEMDEKQRALFEATLAMLSQEKSLTLGRITEQTKS